MSKDGGPAFPGRIEITTKSGNLAALSEFSGMSLRDYFAGQALIGMTFALFMHRLEAKRDTDEINDAEAVRSAYEVADAMLAEREKGYSDASDT